MVSTPCGGRGMQKVGTRKGLVSGIKVELPWAEVWGGEVDEEGV